MEKEDIIAVQFKAFCKLYTIGVDEEGITMGTDKKGFPLLIYASKKVYLEAHFEDYYTWACEFFDTDNIEEDELKKIIESAILKQFENCTDDETIEVYQLYDDCDEYMLHIYNEIENRLDAYFDSKK